VSALVIVNGTARAIRTDGYEFGIPQHIMDRVFEVAVEADAVARGFDGLALFAPTIAEDPSFRRWWRRAGNRGASPAMARTILKLRYQADVRAALDTIHVPTLVLHRRDNHVLRPAHGRYLADHIDGAKLVELPGEDVLYWVGDTQTMLEEIQEFLTGVRHGPDPDRVLATVLFTDIVGSTEMIVEVGERRWRDLLDSHDAAVRRQLERFRGREIKTTGDGVLATFDGPARALLCACAIRDAAAQLGLQIRAGLHAGEIELRDNDVAGMTVHIGQRVQAQAEPGQVLVSATVKDLVAGSNIDFEDRGDRQLKGVPGTWQLFAVKT
jgi:class 3 adenylate cyclase